jgi:hypothetical protein
MVQIFIRKTDYAHLFLVVIFIIQKVVKQMAVLLIIVSIIEMGSRSKQKENTLG